MKFVLNREAILKDYNNLTAFLNLHEGLDWNAPYRVMSAEKVKNIPSKYLRELKKIYIEGLEVVKSEKEADFKAIFRNGEIEFVEVENDSKQ